MPEPGSTEGPKGTSEGNQKPPKNTEASGGQNPLNKEGSTSGSQSKENQRLEEEEVTQNPGATTAAKLIDWSGITSPALLKERGAIDALVGLGKSSEEILTDALQRVAVIQEGQTPEELEKFYGEKEKVIGMLRSNIQELIVERNREMRENYRAQGLYGERKLTEAEKEQIRNARKPEDIEKLFNRMFDRVDSRPQAQFDAAFGSIGTFEHDEFTKTLNEAMTDCKNKGDMGRAQELNLIVQQFENEKAARAIIHNAYFGVLSALDTEKLKDYIDSFQSGWADMAFNKAGVTQAMHFYEQALLIAKEEAGGYLKPKEVVGEMKSNGEGKVNKLAKKMLEEANDKGIVTDKEGKKLEAWQIDRALSFARGLSIITGRTIEIAATSVLPPGATAFTDQYAQRIIAELAPFRHSYKFNVASKFTRALSYVMNRDRKPWTVNEMEDWRNMSMENQIKVLNGFSVDGKDRFYGALNPFEIGGILSRTGWRIAGKGTTMIDGLIQKKISEGQEKPLSQETINNIRKDVKKKNKKLPKDKIEQLINSEIAARKSKIAEDEAWIGTGVQMERKRGAVLRGDKVADDVVKSQLDKMIQRTPLRLFLNLRDVQEKVLKGWKDIRDIQPRVMELALLQEKALQENVQKAFKDNILKETPEIQVLIKEGKFLDILLTREASPDVNEFVNKIRQVWDGGEKDKFFNDFKNKDWKVPYTFGTDDVPYDQYDFETTGLRSVARRWGDMASAAGASKAFQEFIVGMEHYKEQEQIVAAMRKIYDGIKNYNEDDARKFTLRMAEGVIKFYEKDYRHRLPFGIGTVVGMITGKSSAAQIAYGRGAMAWEELHVNEFTRLLRDNGMLTIEEQHKLQQKAGGGKGNVSWGYARTIIPLLMLGIAFHMFNKVKEEKY